MPTKEKVKNVRLNIAVYPELKEKILALAALDRLSLNEFVSGVMDQYIATRAEDIKDFQAAQLRSAQRKQALINS